MRQGQRGRWLIMLALALVGGGRTGDISVTAQQSGLPAAVIAYADMVLYGGKVLTADDAFTIVEAVAIRDGKFLAVGPSTDILRLAGPSTRKIDLAGKTVVPGFIDTHQHLHDYALQHLPKEYRRPRIDFGNVEDGLRKLKALVDSVPAGEWVIIDGGVGASSYPSPDLSMRDLDRVAPNHLVAVGYRRPLGYLLNSNALRKADIPEDTLGIHRDPQTGELTGHVRDMATEMLIQEAFPWTPIEAMVPALRQEMLRENATGLTTVMTRMPGNDLTAVKRLWQRRELTMRWRVGHEFLLGNPRAEAYLKRMGNLEGLGDDMLKISGVSFAANDSAFTTGGDLTWEAKRYTPEGAEHTGGGINKWEDRERSDRKSLLFAIQYGWSITGMHSAGSRANSILLDTYEEAKKLEPIVPTDRQILVLDHGPMLSERYGHLSKMKELGVIPSMGMKYVFTGGERTGRVVAMYGGDRTTEMSPLRSMIDKGLKPAFEADTGEAPYFHPLWQIEKAVTRKDDSGRVWGPHEAVTRQEGLWMATRWAARYTGDEEILGSIEAGKLADLVVLARDYLRVPADELSKIPVVMTVVGGKVVYQADQREETRTVGQD